MIGEAHILDLAVWSFLRRLNLVSGHHSSSCHSHGDVGHFLSQALGLSFIEGQEPPSHLLRAAECIGGISGCAILVDPALRSELKGFFEYNRVVMTGPR